MGLLGNQSRINLGSGYSVGGVYSKTPGAIRNTGERIRFDSQDGSSEVLTKDSWPLGYSDSAAYYLAQSSGSISSFEQVLINISQGSLNIAGGLNAEGLAELSVESSANIIGLTFANGSAVLTVTRSGEINATASLISDLNIDTALTGLASGAIYGDGSATFEFSTIGNLAAAFYILGDAQISFSSDALLNGIVALAGGISVSSSVSAVGSMGVNAIGSAAGVISVPSSLLGGIVDLVASGNIAFSDSVTLRATGVLAGDITPYTELSPQSLSDAVWSASAAAHDVAGSMGEKLNDAGSAANPWTEVIESGYTAEQIMRILFAVAAGKTTISNLGEGEAIVAFRDQADTTNRILANMIGSERDIVVLDPD